ncbi:MAG: cupin-like domain-containing protein [Porphyrobacter sp.]|nr:cupin-like domain-containing protein [Porphyrobacter sp.]
MIFTDAMTDWPALEAWSMAAFARDYGSDLGVAQLGFYDWRGGRATTLGDYIAKLDQPASTLSGFWIDRSGLPVAAPGGDADNLWSFIWEVFSKHPQLRADIGPYPHGAQNLFDTLPQATYAAMEKITQNTYLSLYLSRKDTVTPWHSDLLSTIGSLAQIEGQKRVTLMPGHEEDDRNNEGFDPEAPDYGQFPQMGGRPLYCDVIEPGDMLIIPPDWWHHVRSLSHSITISHNFAIPENASRFLASVQTCDGYHKAKPEMRSLIDLAFSPEHIDGARPQ